LSWGGVLRNCMGMSLARGGLLPCLFMSRDSTRPFLLGSAVNIDLDVYLTLWELLEQYCAVCRELMCAKLNLKQGPGS
jgi:hypothetical protein